MSFGWFLMNGGADAYPGSVHVWNPESNRGHPRSGREWAQMIARRAAEHGLSPDETLMIAIDREAIFVARDAVWAYAAATGINPPSLWPRPSTASPQATTPEKTTSVADADPVGGGGAASAAPSTVGDIVAPLIAFLNAGERMTEAKAFELACAEFGRDAFTTRQWAKARKDMDPAKKLGVGKRK
jgi:hypothetical protein